MKSIKQGGWIYYIGDASGLNLNKCGKWMYFFSNKRYVSNLCEDAINNQIVTEAKHSDAESGVACFYLNCDDILAHKKIITYFIENDLIRKTKAGRLYDISFKLDNQTRAGEYGDDFSSEIKLSRFINLTTGEWLKN